MASNSPIENTPQSADKPKQCTNCRPFWQNQQLKALRDRKKQKNQTACASGWQKSLKFKQEIALKYGRSAFLIQYGINLGFLGTSFVLSKAILSFVPLSKFKSIGILGLTIGTFALASPLRFQASSFATPIISQLLSLKASEKDKRFVQNFRSQMNNNQRCWPVGFGPFQIWKKEKCETRKDLLAEAGISSPSPQTSTINQQ